MFIRISLQQQILTLWQGEQCLVEYPVSTGLNGPGEHKNSGQTPRGRHIIRALIGADAPLNAVFVGRRRTGEVYSSALAESFPARDWILTRILWLSGCEIGKNRLADVDTMQRYIYIHGTPDSEPMGVPMSHGCVRMRNNDIIDLFNKVVPGTSVLIEE
ncbi:MAG: L,D-transpeptidase [Amphritea sp.]|nr:L,D-transpeptidase [Amphritea sp.]